MTAFSEKNLNQIGSALRRSFANLSRFGSLRFTREQLYYEVCRTLRPPQGLDLKTAAAVFAAGSLPVLALAGKQKKALGFVAANAALAGGLAWLRKSPHTLETPVSFAAFEKALEIYLKNNPPGGLLGGEKREFEFEQPTDLPLYGLPRVLVCQSAEIAEMLRANYFHMESSCAVLSLAEAAPLSDVYQKMMKAAEGARVFFLHDASLEAYAQIPFLREQLNLPDAMRLTILGLRPSHAQRMHLFAERAARNLNADLAAISFLLEDEKRWLEAGWLAKVAAVSPVRILRVLRRLVLGLPAPTRFWQISLPARESGFMS